MAIRTCKQCGKEYELPRKGTKAKYVPPDFCSYSCRNKSRIDPSKRSVFVCEWCNQEFESWVYRPNRFCSKRCAAHYGGSVGGRPRKPGNYIMQNCAWCGKEYEESAHQIRLRNAKHCSRDCKYAAMSVERMGEGNPNYNGGHVDDYGPNWHRQKRKAIRRDKHTCQVCGYKTGGDTILDVHHIMPIKEFDGSWKKANKLSNLICLCRICHVKVEKGKIPCPQL